jgi:hypothetical protein
MKIFTLTTPYLKNNSRKLLIVPHLYSDSSIQCSRSNTTAILNPNDKPDYGLKDSETKQGLEERREKGKPHSVEPCGQQRTNLNN